MGIIDKVTTLLPWRGERQESPPARADFLALRDDFDRWLQRLVEQPRGFTVTEVGWTPSADVHETDDELVVTAEVPGLDRDDLTLMITPEGLSIRGEKHEEKKDKRKDYDFVESRYGSF